MVASECNGFGVILTSLLIASPAGPVSPAQCIYDMLNILTGVLIGFLFNTIRIVVIVLLAPSLMHHYMLMHEIIGGISYWGCLISVWLLLQGPIEECKEPRTWTGIAVNPNALVMALSYPACSCI